MIRTKSSETYTMGRRPSGYFYKESETKLLYKKSSFSLSSCTRTVSGMSVYFMRSGLIQIKKRRSLTKKIYEDRGKFKRDIGTETPTCKLRGYIKKRRNRYISNSKCSGNYNSEICANQAEKQKYAIKSDFILEEPMKAFHSSFAAENLKQLVHQYVYYFKEHEKQDLERRLEIIFTNINTSSASSTNSSQQTINRFKRVLKYTSNNSLYRHKRILSLMNYSIIQQKKLKHASQLDVPSFLSHRTVPIVQKKLQIIPTLSIPKNTYSHKSKRTCHRKSVDESHTIYSIKSPVHYDKSSESSETKSNDQPKTSATSGKTRSVISESTDSAENVLSVNRIQSILNDIYIMSDISVPVSFELEKFNSVDEAYYLFGTTNPVSQSFEEKDLSQFIITIDLDQENGGAVTPCNSRETKIGQPMITQTSDSLEVKKPNIQKSFIRQPKIETSLKKKQRDCKYLLKSKKIKQRRQRRPKSNFLTMNVLNNIENIIKVFSGNENKFKVDININIAKSTVDENKEKNDCSTKVSDIYFKKPNSMETCKSKSVRVTPTSTEKVIKCDTGIQINSLYEVKENNPLMYKNIFPILDRADSQMVYMFKKSVFNPQSENSMEVLDQLDGLKKVPDRTFISNEVNELKKVIKNLEETTGLLMAQYTVRQSKHNQINSVDISTSYSIENVCKYTDNTITLTDKAINMESKQIDNATETSPYINVDRSTHISKVRNCLRNTSTHAQRGTECYYNFQKSDQNPFSSKFNTASKAEKAHISSSFKKEKDRSHNFAKLSNLMKKSTSYTYISSESFRVATDLTSAANLSQKISSNRTFSTNHFSRSKSLLQIPVDKKHNKKIVAYCYEGYYNRTPKRRHQCLYDTYRFVPSCYRHRKAECYYANRVENNSFNSNFVHKTSVPSFFDYNQLHILGSNQAAYNKKKLSKAQYFETSCQTDTILNTIDQSIIQTNNSVHTNENSRQDSTKTDTKDVNTDAKSTKKLSTQTTRDETTMFFTKSDPYPNEESGGFRQLWLCWRKFLYTFFILMFILMSCAVFYIYLFNPNLHGKVNTKAASTTYDVGTPVLKSAFLGQPSMDVSRILIGYGLNNISHVYVNDKTQNITHLFVNLSDLGF